MLFISSLMTVALSGASHAQASYSKGMELLQQGKKDLATQEFELVKARDPEFLNSLMEIQKLHYSTQAWDRFFAYAVFYRHRFLKTTEPTEKLRSNFRGRLIALEALALGKHCLWDEARSVARYGIELAKKLQIAESQEVQEIQDALAQIELLHEFPKARKARPGEEVIQPAFSLENYWPIRQRSLDAIQDPSLLRFKLKGKCL
jgi:hypothetical protein